MYTSAVMIATPISVPAASCRMLRGWARLLKIRARVDLDLIICRSHAHQDHALNSKRLRAAARARPAGGGALEQRVQDGVALVLVQQRDEEEVDAH